MADLKDEIISKIDQKFKELKPEFQSELKDQIKKVVSEAIKTIMFLSFILEFGSGHLEPFWKIGFLGT